MIRINQLKLPINHSEKELLEKIRKTLKLQEKKGGTFTYEITKRSIDARKKPELFYVYSVLVSVQDEVRLVKKIHSPSIVLEQKKGYHLPECGSQQLHQQPVIIGAGPAGLFAAYLLVEAGFSPIVLERGRAIERRTADVEEFWKTGCLDPTSNVQFGEGGAGTFSDGKLNTAVKDSSGRNTFVLETFVRFGAPSSILVDSKPHIGTDVLSSVIVNMRNYLLAHGCQIHFETCVTDFVIEDQRIKGVCFGEKQLEAEAVILAPGHSARDTFLRLKELSIPMEAKNFAVGFRVEHPQKMIDDAMYGKGNAQKFHLPAAPYKVTSNFPNGRGVYSFCMCPGGYVVNSSSIPGQTVVNGMSYSARDSRNANSAIIVSVGVKDFGGTDALAGMHYQSRLEKETFQRGKGKIPQQLFGDFCERKNSTSYGGYASCTRGEAVFADLRGLMSSDMEESLIQGMQHFGHIIPDYDRKDAILSGMETRTSSPIRIIRDKALESEIKGLYPCGEGAGYAGGITSAAMDGIKVAEAIIRKYRVI